MTLDKTINDFFHTRLFEIDGQFVALDRLDRTIAKLDVEHALAEGKLRWRVTDRLGNQFALDGERPLTLGAGGAVVVPAFAETAAGLGCPLRPLPAGRRIGA